MEERFLRRSLSREEPDLDPGPSGRDRGLSREGTDLDLGPSGRDRGHLHKGVVADKPGDCFGALCALVTWLSSYVSGYNSCLESIRAIKFIYMSEGLESLGKHLTGVTDFPRNEIKSMEISI